MEYMGSLVQHQSGQQCAADRVPGPSERRRDRSHHEQRSLRTWSAQHTNDLHSTSLPFRGGMLQGMFIGQLLFGMVADMLGRKLMFVTTMILVIVGTLGSATLSWNFYFVSVFFCIGNYLLADCIFCVQNCDSGE